MNPALPIEHFVCNLKSKHLCLPKYEGGEPNWAYQYGRRFILADNIEDARAYFAEHFQDQKFWPKGFHEVESFSLTGISNPSEKFLYVGYGRFSLDIRTGKNQKEVLQQFNLIKNKVANYLKNSIDIALNPDTLSVI